jgi:hypothetical protein
MKLKTFLTILLIGLTMQTKTGQLFEQFNNMLDRGDKSINPTPIPRADVSSKHEDNNSIFDIVSDAKQIEKQLTVTNNQGQNMDASFLQKNQNDLTNLKKQVEKLKNFNMHLNKHLNSKGIYEEKETKFNSEAISLLEKSEKSLYTLSEKANKNIINQLNNNKIEQYAKDLDENLNFLQTKLKNTKSKLDKTQNASKIDLSNVESVIVKDNLVSHGANVKSVTADKLDLNSLKGDSEGMHLDGNLGISIGDKTIPAKYLLQYHKMMEQLRQLCGEDLTKCKYYDTKKIEEDAINQTTLLSEIRHLEQITERLNRN